MTDLSSVSYVSGLGRSSEEHCGARNIQTSVTSRCLALEDVGGWCSSE